MMKWTVLLAAMIVIALLFIQTDIGLLNNSIDDYPSVNNQRTVYSLKIQADNTTNYSLIVPIPTGWEHEFFNHTTVISDSSNYTLTLESIDNSSTLLIDSQGNLSIFTEIVNHSYDIDFIPNNQSDGHFMIYSSWTPLESSVGIIFYYETSYDIIDKYPGGSPYLSDQGSNLIIFSNDKHPPPRTFVQLHQGWQWINVIEIMS